MTNKDRQLFYWRGEAEKQLLTWKTAPDKESKEREKQRYVEIRQIIDEIERRASDV